MSALLRTSVVSYFEGIPLTSMSGNHADFQNIVTRSLELIRDIDNRRFKRVLHQTKWLMNTSLSLGPYSGLYWHHQRAVTVDFSYQPDKGDELWHAGYFAGVIVHEATHGVLEDKGFAYNEENRTQIERICTAEQNRFVMKLNKVRPNLGNELQEPFDSGNWEPSWNSTRLKDLFLTFRKIREKEKSS